MKLKRIFTILLCVIFIIGMMPIGILASDIELSEIAKTTEDTIDEEDGIDEETVVNETESSDFIDSASVEAMETDKAEDSDTGSIEGGIITISNIDTSQLTGEESPSSTEIKVKGLPADEVQIVSEEWSGPDEFVIGRDNIAIRGGKYSYKLVIRTNRTLTFDNDLEIFYQGVNGKYKMHYDIDETDNHTMIVSGLFENIIIESPLMQILSAKVKNWILSHISEDSYFYQLVLKTKEGFSFINALRFLFDEKQCGYSINYDYDLLQNSHSLVISGIPDCDQTENTLIGNVGEKNVQEPGESFEQEEEQEIPPAHEHTYKSIVEPATFSKDGSITEICEECNAPGQTTRIKQIKPVKPDQTSFTYNGRVQKPKVTVSDSAGKAIPTRYYTVSYSDKNSKAAGTYEVTVKFNGKYSGSKTIQYKINKADNTITKVTSSKTVKLSTLNKKDQVFAISAAVKEKAGIAFTLKSVPKAAQKYITVSKSGKVTIKKGLKKDTYKIKVQITAGKTKNYKKTSVTKTIDIIVK